MSYFMAWWSDGHTARDRQLRLHYNLITHCQMLSFHYSPIAGQELFFKGRIVAVDDGRALSPTSSSLLCDSPVRGCERLPIQQHPYLSLTSQAPSGLLDHMVQVIEQPAHLPGPVEEPSPVPGPTQS